MKEKILYCWINDNPYSYVSKETRSSREYILPCQQDEFVFFPIVLERKNTLTKISFRFLQHFLNVAMLKYCMLNCWRKKYILVSVFFGDTEWLLWWQKLKFWEKKKFCIYKLKKIETDYHYIYLSQTTYVVGSKPKNKVLVKILTLNHSTLRISIIPDRIFNLTALGNR